MFTALPDPRGQALSQFGSGIGSALSNALGSYIENRKFNNALQGVNANTPVHDILSRFSQHNVSPDLVNQYLNPQVQNRVSQERAIERINQLKSQQNPNVLQTLLGLAEAGVNSPAVAQQLGDVAQILQKQASIQNYPGGGNTGNAPVNLGRNTAAANVTPEGQSNSTPLPGVRPSHSNTRSNPVKPLYTRNATPTTGSGILDARASGIGGQVAPGQGQAPIQPENDLLNENPFLEDLGLPPSPEQLAGITREVANVTGSLEEGKDFADRYARANASQREAMKDNINFRKAAKEEQIQQNAHYRKQAENFLKREGREADTLALDAISTRMSQLSGDEQTRFRKALKEQDQIQDKAQKILVGEKRPVAAAFRAPELAKFYEKQGNALRSLVNEASIPAHLRDQYIDRFRTVAQQADIGPLEFELMINPLTQNEAKILNSIPELKKVPQKSTGSRIAKEFSAAGSIGLLPAGINAIKQNFEKSPKDLLEKTQKKQENFINENPKIVEMVGRVIRENDRASPLIIRDALMDKGLSNPEVGSIFDELKRQGFQFSPYQEVQIGDLSIEPKASLSSILLGEQSAIGLWDQVIQGKR